MRLTTDRRLLSSVLALCLFGVGDVKAGEIPTSFDLRDYDGVNYVTPVRSQSGGTCWCFGTMGAFEGNLMRTGAWTAAGEIGKPDMAEYHLDWWNGFNDFNNDDIDPPTGDGLSVHNGGDYRVATAYFSRRDGAVREVDAPTFDDPSPRWDESYHHYYPRDVIWLNAGEDLGNIDTIKTTIMEHGCIAMCMAYHSSLIQNYRHYQPPEDEHPINHSLTIVGWDDDEPTPAPLPGAWLVKNSWGASWGLNGYFWVSYYDKACAQHPEMGCVSFQNIVPNEYDHTYYHDYHGWRDQMPDVAEAFNAFVGVNRQLLQAVSFFTIEDDVEYTVKIYDSFEGGELLDELTVQSGTIQYKGYHTVDLAEAVYIYPGDDFYIHVLLSHGGHAYDCTGEVEEMMGAPLTRAIVTSTANPGESFYRENDAWLDLTDFNDSANFCIKGLAVDVGLVVAADSETGETFVAEGPHGGPFTPASKTYHLTNTDPDPIEYAASFSPCLPWLRISGETAGTLPSGDSVDVAVEINANAGLLPNGYNLGEVEFVNLSFENGSTTRAVEVLVGDAPVLYEWTFDTDPDWDERADWNWGLPQGQGGQNGYPDPVSGHTGDYVYGYNLSGDYPNNLGFKALRTPDLEIPELLHARLTFWRWLGVQGDGLDNAAVALNADDQGFSSLWRAETEITDSEWVYQDFDITDRVQGASIIRLRWSMGVTDDSETYCGWNIDDVRLLGFSVIQPIIGDLNDDGDVNLDDLARLLGFFGMTGVQPQDGDLDGDGDVDLSDLAELLSLYQTGCM